MGFDEDKTKIYWLLAIAVASSTGLSTLIQGIDPNARNDPYTGKEGRRLERQVEKMLMIIDELPPDTWEEKVDDIADQLEDLKDKFYQHLSLDSTTRYRVGELEKEVERIHE